MGAETDDAPAVGPLGRLWRKVGDKALTAAAWWIYSLLAAGVAGLWGIASGEFAASTPGGLALAAAGGAAVSAALTLGIGWWLQQGRARDAEAEPTLREFHRAWWADGKIRYPIHVGADARAVVLSPVCTKCGSGVTFKYWRSHRAYFATCVTCNTAHAAAEEYARSVEIRRAVEGLLASGVRPDQLQARIESLRASPAKD